MKRLAFVALMGLALVGCDAQPDSSGNPAEDRGAYTLRTYDVKYGVACYRFGPSSNNLSCVKVN